MASVFRCCRGSKRKVVVPVTKDKLTGAAGFDSYYRALFPGRWDSLSCALRAPSRQIAWQEKLTQPYYLDAGSVAAALSMPVDDVSDDAELLDMCAAPGGKTLVLSRILHTVPGVTIIANERSAERKNRLQRVLVEHLDPALRSRITVTNRDAARWCRYEQDKYDFVLLDAPCSSERHVLSSPAYLKDWSPARIKTLAVAQWALLSSAYLVTKPGGFIVYSTCALSPAENDDVIKRLLKKYCTAEIIPATQPEIYREMLAVSPEQTEFGSHVLPDTSAGAGPLYYCVIRKT